MHAMAKTNSSSQCSIIATALLLIILSSSSSLESIETNNNNDEHDDHEYVKSPKELGLINQEKLSHFHFYWHDIVSGRNPTSVVVIPPLSNTSASLFGMLVMIDDPLTEGPGLGSRLVGKAQGIYAAVGQQEQGLLMAMNFVFLAGKYNGSGITVMGRNSVLSEVREMPVIGGTGLLRFSRGYVRARTHKFNSKTGDAIVEYNAYVLHY